MTRPRSDAAGISGAAERAWTVVVVERADEGGHRWDRALELLLEAGRIGEDAPA
jgi:hypothetical protein